MTPTRASALISCPAREPSWAPPTDAPTRLGTDIGSLAHHAIEQWLVSGDWQCRGAQDALTKRFVALARPDRANTARARLVVSRLRARADELGSFLETWENPRVRIEQVLMDRQRGLWGRADILITSQDRIGLIEVKTGERESAGTTLNEHEIRQVLFYAHLMARDAGRVPDVARLFSLKRGLIEVPVTEEKVARVIEEAVRARDRWVAGNREERPAPEVCTFCPRRLRCSPSWDALSSWPNRDGVEGVVHRLDEAANGRISLVVQRNSATVVISGLVRKQIGRAQVGDRVRVLGLQPSPGRRGYESFAARSDAQLLVVQRRLEVEKWA